MERFKEAWEAAWDSDEYRSARDGDHLITPFECDLCIFIKLKNRYPISTCDKDKRLAACIRRISLDAFWSRASTTVANNLRLVKKSISLSESVGLLPPFLSQGPLPEWDHCGYQVAINMVLYSTKAGRYDKLYIQFDTIRHLRSAFSNFEKTMMIGPDLTVGMNSKSGCDKESVTHTIWFRRFYSGCKARMGQIVKPNLALTTDLIVSLANRLMRMCSEASDKEEKFNLVVFGSYVVVTYVISLRGSEGLMLDLTVINRELMSDRDYCIIALKGKVKGESSHRDHLFPTCIQTSSGINVRRWLRMLSAAQAMAGRNGGPAITGWDGSLLSTNKLDARLHEHLSAMFEEGFTFPFEIKTLEDIYERFSVFRSLRRASATWAIEQNVSVNDTDVVNRWKSTEASKGKKPNRPMRQHYAEISKLTQPFLRHTLAM